MLCENAIILKFAKMVFTLIYFDFRAYFQIKLNSSNNFS